MKKYSTLLSFVVLAALASSCETTTTPAGEAKKLTVAQIQTNPGFAWFDYERTSYTPNADTVILVRDSYRADDHQVYIHVNPSCSCTGTQKLFPKFMRIMQDAGIPETEVAIYSMARSGDNHPETKQFNITKLPSIFITRNDTLIATINDVSATMTVEQQILEALTK